MASAREWAFAKSDPTRLLLFRTAETLNIMIMLQNGHSPIAAPVVQLQPYPLAALHLNSRVWQLKHLDT